MVRILVLGAVIGAVSTQVVLGTPGDRGRTVIVQPGATLWQIAAQNYPQSDPRAAVAAVQQANHLGGAVIFPGEHLVLPPFVGN